MLTLEQLRKIDPDLKDCPDEELIKIRSALYELGNFAFDTWLVERNKKDIVL